MGTSFISSGCDVIETKSSVLIQVEGSTYSFARGPSFCYSAIWKSPAAEKMTKSIDSFNGRYRFLSNFAPCKVTYEGIEYSSTEHAYQAAKTLDTKVRKFIAEAETPGEAKKRGQKCILRPEWETIKLDVMLDLLKQKLGSQISREPC